MGSWKENWLGIDQIVQFDWNLAVGDLELSETDFREIVRKKKRLVQIQGKWFQRPVLFQEDPAVYPEEGTPYSGVKYSHLGPVGTGRINPAEQEAGTEDDALRVEVS